MNKFNIYFIFRILIGCVFLVSGFEKVISPYQNFLYVIESYEFLPQALHVLTAQYLPWIELLLGVFLILGLWTSIALKGASVFFAAFICIVSQAMIRNLPISDCGCFGEMASFPLYFILILDNTLLLMTWFAFKNCAKANWLSLDNYFESSN